MKNKFLNIALLAIILMSGTLSITSCSERKENEKEEKEKYGRERENEEGEEEEEEESGADKELTSWFWAKGYPDATNMNGKYQQAWEQYLEIKNNTPREVASRIENLGSWTFTGPKVFGGRILCLAINPTLNAAGKRTIFAGSASGGIWKTYVSGQGASAWQPVVTNTHVLGVAAITYHPTDTSIILAGTGEVYRVENYTSNPYSYDQVSNIGRNAWKARGTYGVGILRSTDAGATWTQVLVKNQSDLFGIQKIKFQPGSTTVVFACASDGLYKSTNAGVTWNKIWTGNYCSDIVINAANTQQIVIAAGNVTNNPKGVWRSVDGGATFTQVTGTGFPAFNQFRGFTALNMLGSTPDTIIASVGAGDVNVDGTYNEVEIYRSGDFGSTWASVSNSHHSKYQSWFSHGVTPFPGNPKKAFIYGTSGIVLTMSGNPATTGAAATVGSNNPTMNSFLTDGQQEGPSSYLHSDIHDVEFVPGSSTTAYWATDGGVFLTTDQGATFSSCNGGLNVQQFYPTLAQSQNSATPNLMIGGLQDNNVVKCNNTSGATIAWARTIGGDGGPSAFQPNNETILLSSTDTRGVNRSTNTGTSYGTSPLTYLGNVPFGNDDRTSFCSPIGVSAAIPTRFYVGSDNLHVSTDGGATFNASSGGSGVPGTNYIEALHKPAIAIGIGPVTSVAANQKVYVSVSPFSQNISTDALFYTPPANIRKSTDGGSTFVTVTNGLPDRMVTDFAFSSTFEDSVFVTLGGFGTTHIYVSGDGGSTWTPRGSGLPDVPFNTIVFDPNNSKIMYAGCDFGVYVSQDRGATWYDYNNGLWDATYVMDLVIVPGTPKKLRAVTHGKGIFESPLWTFLATLPVNFKSFTGVNQGTSNSLTWITEQENNLAHYEVERSVDGFNYQLIKQVTARNTPTQSTYNVNDYIGTNPAPVYYYRIKSINLDGTYEYSDVIRIKISGKAKFEVLGNPFTSSLTVRYTVPQTGKLQISLTDMQGRLLKAEETIAGSGTNTYSVNNLSAIPSGIYLLNLDMDKQRTTIKVLKR